MSDVVIRQESLASSWDEAQPLTRLHYKEVEDQRMPFELDRKQYALLDSLDLIKVFTVRDEGMLVGYATYLITPNLHHASTRVATCDCIFVQPVYRGRTGRKLIAYAEEKLERCGVSFVFINTKTQFDFGPVLKRDGYKHVENVYSKKLGD